MVLQKMYQMKGAKSPIADLQYGGLYQGRNGTYFKKYPAISKFASPNFSGDPKRTQRGRVRLIVARWLSEEGRPVSSC